MSLQKIAGGAFVGLVLGAAAAHFNATMSAKPYRVGLYKGGMSVDDRLAVFESNYSDLADTNCNSARVAWEKAEGTPGLHCTPVPK